MKHIEFYQLDTEIDGVKYYKQKLGSNQRVIPDQRLGLQKLHEIAKEIIKRDYRLTKQTHYKIVQNKVTDLTRIIKGI